jgi:catechol 2,3-dioxygenase-like lactoylglutathione lyase family enzyme
MLGDKDAMANISVKDIEAAKGFYEGTLGLKRVATEGKDAVVYQSGKSQILVYVSQYAGTNKATSVSWMVDHLEETVNGLRNRGVRFERYDFPDTTHEGDIHVSGKRRMAWFKDPEGNILHVFQKP